MEATSKLLGRGFNANQLIKKQTISGLRASSGSSATLRNLQRIRLPLRCWARVLSLSDSSSSAGILSLLPLFPLTFKPCAYEQPVISPNHATADEQKKFPKRNVTSVTCNMAMIRGPLPRRGLLFRTLHRTLASLQTPQRPPLSPSLPILAAPADSLL